MHEYFHNFMNEQDVFIGTILIVFILIFIATLCAISIIASSNKESGEEE